MQAIASTQINRVEISRDYSFDNGEDLAIGTAVYLGEEFLEGKRRHHLVFTGNVALQIVGVLVRARR